MVEKNGMLAVTWSYNFFFFPFASFANDNDEQVAEKNGWQWHDYKTR